MKQQVFKRMIAACAAMCLIGSFCACRKEAEFHLEDFEDHRDTTAITYAFFENDTSSMVVYEEAALSAFQQTLTERRTVYPYPELFHYEKAMSGMHSGYAVAEHAHSVLDVNGEWEFEHFVDVVQANSTAYLAEQDSTILKEVNEELMRRICEIITEVITEVLEQYPDIDRDRVYCNLGNLKIVEKGSALDFAAVEPGMVLHVNPSTSGMADLFTSSNMHSVIVHETMHILQYGCECEKNRRAYTSLRSGVCVRQTAGTGLFGLDVAGGRLG